MSALPKISTNTAQRNVRFSAFGSPDVLEVAVGEVPEPGAGEVRIRVEASSVQFTDTLIRRGLYPDLPKRSAYTPGYDAVGVVEALGDGVSAFAVGDRVADLTMVGGNARYLIRPAAGLVAVPERVDAAEATTLVLSWLTAYQALFRTAELKKGERVLVIGGNGSVGLAAIALAVRAGHEVYATAREVHHERLRGLGAIPLPRDAWQATLAELGGADVVLDGIAADGFRSTWAALREGGRLVGIGASAAAGRGSKLEAIVAFVRLLIGFRLRFWDNRSARFYSITDERRAKPEQFRDDLAKLFGWLDEGAIQPRVDERLTLNEIADAHARLEAGGLSGKLVVFPWR